MRSGSAQTLARKDNPVQRGRGMELSLSQRPSGPWLFGKLPGHGDFIARGLSPALRDALDIWLSQGLDTARRNLADEFDERYFSSPPWYFIDRDPDGQWSGGALCFSVDSARRRFPLLVGFPVEDPALAEETALACVDVACAAVAGGWTADATHHALMGIEPVICDTPPANALWTLAGDQEMVTVIDGRFPGGIIGQMLEIRE